MPKKINKNENKKINEVSGSDDLTDLVKSLYPQKNTTHLNDGEFGEILKRFSIGDLHYSRSLLGQILKLKDIYPNSDLLIDFWNEYGGDNEQILTFLNKHCLEYLLSRQGDYYSFYGVVNMEVEKNIKRLQAVIVKELQVRKYPKIRMREVLPLTHIKKRSEKEDENTPLHNEGRITITGNRHVKVDLPTGEIYQCKFHTLSNPMRLLNYLAQSPADMSFKAMSEVLKDPKAGSDSPNPERRVRDTIQYIKDKLGLSNQSSIFDSKNSYSLKYKVARID